MTKNFFFEKRQSFWDVTDNTGRIFGEIGETHSFGPTSSIATYPLLNNLNLIQMVEIIFNGEDVFEVNPWINPCLIIITVY